MKRHQIDPAKPINLSLASGTKQPASSKPMKPPPAPDLIDENDQVISAGPAPLSEAAKKRRTLKRVTARTPKERLKTWVDDALDVLEEGLEAKDGAERRRIAIEILDRAGILKPKGDEEAHDDEADARLAQAIANAFRGGASLLGISIRNDE